MYQYCNGASAHRFLLQPVTRYVAQSRGQMEETLTEYAARIRLVTRSKRATKELRSYVQHACANTSQLCVTRSPWSDVVGQGSKYDYAVSVLPTDKRKSPRFTIDSPEPYTYTQKQKYHVTCETDDDRTMLTRGNQVGKRGGDVFNIIYEQQCL